ncbi:MAG TPA: GIY-YIG nuclease family protein [Thermomicrobiales bacterium]|nr:GIY-YIG nuclease family protein [Thermomicrobiales bacterium]
MGVERGCGKRQAGGIREVYIYALCDPRDGVPRYIGKTVEPTKRLSMHLWQAKHGAPHHRDRWIRTLLAEGVEPEMRLIECCNETEWVDRERHWIATLPNLTNLAAGGEGIDLPHTPEWNARIGAAHRGKIFPRESADKMSAHHRAKHDGGCKNGHPWTPENTGWRRNPGERPYRACPTCQRESQGRARRAVGIPPREEWVPPMKEVCTRGHPLSGDNLRILVRRGHTERICRECVRIRNRAKKARDRAMRG